jgi:hypothetical protein
MRLTGERVIDHYTAANFSPLYDVDPLDWITTSTTSVGPERLPGLMWSTDIAGQVTAKRGGRDRARRRHARHLRHHRRGGRGGERRRARPAT